MITNLSIIQKYLFDPTKAEFRNNLSVNLTLTGLGCSVIAHGCFLTALASLVSSITHPVFGSFIFAASTAGFLISKDIITLSGNIIRLLHSYSTIPSALTTESLVNTILKDTLVANLFLKNPLIFLLNQPRTLEDLMRA